MMALVFVMCLLNSLNDIISAGSFRTAVQALSINTTRSWTFRLPVITGLPVRFPARIGIGNKTDIAAKFIECFKAANIMQFRQERQWPSGC